jgi:hypothetical protein
MSTIQYRPNDTANFKGLSSLGFWTVILSSGMICFNEFLTVRDVIKSVFWVLVNITSCELHSSLDVGFKSPLDLVFIEGSSFPSFNLIWFFHGWVFLISLLDQMFELHKNWTPWSISMFLKLSNIAQTIVSQPTLTARHKGLIFTTSYYSESKGNFICKGTLRFAQVYMNSALEGLVKNCSYF